MPFRDAFGEQFAWQALPAPSGIVAVDTARVQAAHDALPAGGGVIVGLPGTYAVSGFNWTKGNVSLLGAGRSATVFVTAAGDLINLGTPGVSLGNIAIRDLTLQSAVGGGDVFAPKMAAGKFLLSSVFASAAFQQDNPAGYIAHWDGPGMIDVVWSSCQFQHVLNGSVNPLYFRSGGGDLNAVKFTNRCRFTNCRDQGQFVYVESTAAGTYAYDWTFDDVTCEILRGGFLKGLGMFAPRLVQVGNYDMAASGASTGDFVLFDKGSGGALTRDFHIAQMGRRNGALGGGFNDIKLTAAGVAGGHIGQVQNATLSTFTIDLGTCPGVLLEALHNNVVVNNRSGNTLEVWPDQAAGTALPSVRFGAGPVFIASAAGSPETVVTAPVGSLYLRTDGGAATSLYVKETGVGNTGWVGK